MPIIPAFVLYNLCSSHEMIRHGRAYLWRRERPAWVAHKVLWRFALARNARPGQYQAEIGGYPGNVS
jgi:hypothetical protein